MYARHSMAVRRPERLQKGGHHFGCLQAPTAQPVAADPVQRRMKVGSGPVPRPVNCRTANRIRHTELDATKAVVAGAVRAERKAFWLLPPRELIFGGGPGQCSCLGAGREHSPNTPTTGLRKPGNDTSRSTGGSGRPKAATRRNMRREERVTVQGPVKEQQPDGMSHRGFSS